MDAWTALFADGSRYQPSAHNGKGVEDAIRAAALHEMGPGWQALDISDRLGEEEGTFEPIYLRQDVLGIVRALLAKVDAYGNGIALWPRRLNFARLGGPKQRVYVEFQAADR